jgi:hypothetical protein
MQTQLLGKVQGKMADEWSVDSFRRPRRGWKPVARRTRSYRSS